MHACVFSLSVCDRALWEYPCDVIIIIIIVVRSSVCLPSHRVIVKADVVCETDVLLHFSSETSHISEVNMVGGT
jgi:hypothetical protein